MKGDDVDERDLRLCRCICTKVQYKRFCTIKDMPVRSRDHGWIIDSGKKRKWPLMAAGFVFIFSYILIMAKFVKICMDER